MNCNMFLNIEQLLLVGLRRTYKQHKSYLFQTYLLNRRRRKKKKKLKTNIFLTVLEVRMEPFCMHTSAVARATQRIKLSSNLNPPKKRGGKPPADSLHIADMSRQPWWTHTTVVPTIRPLESYIVVYATTEKFWLKDKLRKKLYRLIVFIIEQK